MCSALPDVRFVPIADMVLANPKQASHEPNGSSALNPNLCYSANDQGANMRRRQFIVMLGVGGVWPLLAQAQQPTAPVIGFMSGRSPDESKHLVAAFHRGLGEVGFVEGKNIAVEYRWALGQYDRLPALAAELVKSGVVVLAAVGGDPSALAAKQATSTIPVVFGLGGDPVKAGIVESLNRPGANATGFTLLTSALEPKRLGLLRDLVPSAAVIGVLVNPNFPPAAAQLTTLEKAAETISRQLNVFKASNDAELSVSLTSLLQQRVNALLVMSDPYFDTRRDRIIAFAAQNKLPAIYQFREYAVDGGLISYGPSITDAYRHAGNYVGQILKGAKPADLPVLQPTKYEFVINLKTAKSLGLTIPSGLISFADEVIE
jgi:putative ABC transport system substrate-binding protein